MNTPLSSSELLSTFLDGELDESMTTTLFYTLAHDQELQLEMRQLIAIRNGFQSGLLTPPDALRHALHHRLGFPAPAPIAPVAVSGVSSATHIVASKPFLMLLTALTASLLTLLFVHTDAEPSYPIPQPARLDMFLPAQSQQFFAQQPSALPVPAKRSTVVQHQKKADIPHVATRQEIPPARALVSEGNFHIGQAEQQQTSTTITTPEFSTIALSTSVQPLSTSEDEELFLPSETSDERKFSLNLRGFSGRSFPAIDLPPLAEPPINNIAVGLLYNLDEHHALGVEMGQESLLQKYEGIRDGIGILVEQNYLALWGGISYRYTLTSSQALQPFGGVVLGSTSTGPMARLSLGAVYRLGTFSLSAGVEGMLHTFRYQNRWFSTQKINATYGVSFYF